MKFTVLERTRAAALGAGGARLAPVDPARRSQVVEQLRKLAETPSFTADLSNFAAYATTPQSTSDRPQYRHRLDQIRDHVQSLKVPYDPDMRDFAGSPAAPSGRPTLLVSFDFDDNLFDSSHTMCELGSAVLTREPFWPEVEAKLGNITQDRLGRLLQEELLRNPSPFHGLPSLATGLARMCKLEDSKALYEALIKEYADWCKEPGRFGVVLGSPDFFKGLIRIRQEFHKLSIDVVYLILTNKEQEVFVTQYANMMADGYISPYLFDGAIAWPGRGTLEDYEESHAKKPYLPFLYNAVDTHRTPLSMARVPVVNPALMRYVHIGDSASSDVRLALNIKRRHPDMGVSAILTNTTSGIADPKRLVDIVGETVDARVHVYVTSHQPARGLDDALRRHGAVLSDVPSDFHYGTPHPDGDRVGWTDVLRQLYAEGRLLQIRKFLPPSASLVDFGPDLNGDPGAQNGSGSLNGLGSKQS